jgi:hypothetical protein
MKVFAVFLLSFVLAACQAPSAGPRPSAALRPASADNRISFRGGDGSSFESAIIIHAPDNASGVRAEYDYIKRRYPGYRFVGQALANRSGKVYDIMTFFSADGKKRVLYFDITQFFGRW